MGKTRFPTPAGTGYANADLLQRYFPPPFPLGNVYFVGSTHADAGDSEGKGRSPDAPFATLDYAAGRCTAGNDDVIVLLPGHTDTVTAAGGVTLDVAGVRVIGIGTGSLRPTVNFTTATTASLLISAANVTIENVLFTGGIDALVNPVHIQAADCVLRDVETRDVTGQATDFIVTTAAANRLLIERWTHRGAAAAGADTALSIVGGDGVTVRDFWIDGNFAVACIENVTTAATNLSVYGTRPCFARNRNSGDIILTAVSTTTGSVGPFIYARLADDATNVTEAFVGADMQFYSPLQIVNADGERAVEWDGTQTAG